MPKVQLVPGRSCGDCNACCSYYAIADLAKSARPLCANWKTPGGCGIYATRPHACRDFYCVWLQNATLDDGWRPDRSGFILRETYSNIPAHYAVRHGVVFELYGPPSSIESDRFLQAVTSQIRQNVPVFLSVLGPGEAAPRFTLLNERLAAAVASRQRPPLVEALRAALVSLGSQ